MSSLCRTCNVSAFSFMVGTLELQSFPGHFGHLAADRCLWFFSAYDLHLLVLKVLSTGIEQLLQPDPVSIAAAFPSGRDVFKHRHREILAPTGTWLFILTTSPSALHF